MDALVLSTLLFNTAGIVAFAVVMTLAYMTPKRRRVRSWVSGDASVARAASKDVELPHAA